MTTSRHWKEVPKDERHPQRDASTGCLYKHQGKPKATKTDPACAYKVNGYDETRGTRSKRNLYELDPDDELKGAWRVGLRKRLTVRERLLGKVFEEKVNEGRAPKSGERDRHRPVNPTDQKGAWAFEGNNYKQAIRPFFHEYHHILPTESVFDHLNANELEILQDKARYNINSKKNMIILPCTRDISAVLGLPTHLGRHGRETGYAMRCANALVTFKQTNSALKDKPCDVKEDDARKLKDSLERWQQKEYWLIVKFGRANPEADLNSMPPILKV
ncbi:AHH domain-containing protein [Pyxidicoccus parkwayensis]|uniref:AHH domain-containing protein n=1 Tax=Pyxidicoccus parkwayensis TaxID=2813578 RepID=A0ABX7P809_9BACT|nr:AHH domain-containing protein [Pyxidicoccus parkwaysis]QSQ26649.1 AHH domain-containing protein [Pyxidicoccus parkwaysis]